MNVTDEISPEALISRAEGVKFTRLDDEMLAIDSVSGYCYSLNATAGRIWALIEPPISVEDLCCRLQATYRVEAAVCRNDTVELLVELRDASLVKIDPVVR